MNKISLHFPLNLDLKHIFDKQIENIVDLVKNIRIILHPICSILESQGIEAIYFLETKKLLLKF